MNLPIQSVADRYAAAVSNMEVRWKLLQTRKFDPRLLAQYVRSLRQCGRLRARIESMTKEGALWTLMWTQPEGRKKIMNNRKELTGPRGCVSRLVSRCYGRECDNDRERMLEMALRDLWRNYPEWPSTFGPCHNPDCNGSGRGSGLCAQCVTDCIAEIVGMNGPAEAMKRAVEDARMTASKLREMVSPANA